MSKSKQQKSRRNLLLVLSAFLVPVIVAKMALDNQWFDYGVTNQGELVEQSLTLTDIGISDEQAKGNSQDKQWLIIYSLPENCKDQCLYTLKGMENSYFALGRETPRVTPIALTSSPFNAEQLKGLNKQHWQIYNTPEKAKENLSHAIIYVADPLGNIVLSYKGPTSELQIPEFGKAMLTDLRKLLKYSRIG